MRALGTATFGHYPFDRAAGLRHDSAAIERLLARPDCLILPLWRLKPLVDFAAGVGLAFLPPEAAVFRDAVGEPCFLGLTDSGAPRFAIDVSAWDDPEADAAALAAFADPTRNRHPSLPETQQFAELRSVMADLPAEEAGVAAAARGLVGWHGLHRYCANCGQLSKPSHAGWQRGCPSCGRQHFPRTDPVVIMLITRGNRLLLGRSGGWPEGMYSLLAGFIEPGETIEAAVRRETFEEAGISVGRVEYLASQPWPFPASLMLGCRGEALNGDIIRDRIELEDALWVSREEVLDATQGNNPALRPARKGSIARFLIEAWLAGRLD
ncbi:MAG: NAD(+) diphosphatase [Paracoccaceae bacterium]